MTDIPFHLRGPTRNAQSPAFSNRLSANATSVPSTFYRPSWQRPVAQDLLQLLDATAFRPTLGDAAVAAIFRGLESIRQAFGISETATRPSLTRNRDVAFAITSAFEGGKPQSLQTFDDGIVSYGMHQATLRSGSLELVLDSYLSQASSPVAEALVGYMPLVREKDIGLRDDEKFHNLLRAAAQDESMTSAQHEVFGTQYWEPAVRSAESANLKSALAQAVFYDTKIQGGLHSILRTTQHQLDGSAYTESEFLASFLCNRRDYLIAVSETKRANGLSAQADALLNDAESRVGFYEGLLNESNLNIDGAFEIKGVTVGD